MEIFILANTNTGVDCIVSAHMKIGSAYIKALGHDCKGMTKEQIRHELYMKSYTVHKIKLEK